MARARRQTAWAVVVSASAVLTAGPMPAQPPSAPSHQPASGGKSGKDPDVPVAYRPPPGMCRVWLSGVPASQQPAPTDCASAVRNRPSNGRVLFGDDYAKKTSSVHRVRPALAFTVAAIRPGVTGAWRVSAASYLASGENAASHPRAVPGAPDSIADATTVTRTASRRSRTRTDDEYEAGYAAGYRDAMNGRRPRFRGADRNDPGTNATNYAPRAGSRRDYPDVGYGQPGYVQPGYGQPAYGQPAYGQPGGALVVVPPGQDPRYFNSGRYPPPGRANGVCLDRDGDGWCDDPRFGGAYCRDLDGDGRCDDYPALAAAPYPSSLPDMRAGVDVQQGRGSPVALRWLGTSEVVARLVNPKRTATPYRVLWFDANTNALLQTWTDLDGDGLADRVEIFRNGRRVKLLGR